MTRLLAGSIVTALVALVTSCGSPEPAKHEHGSLLRVMAGSERGAMTTFELGGFALAGAEYWPYAGAAEPRYPEDVMWGFYPKKGVTPSGETDPNPDTASRAAVACAERAHAELRAFLTQPPKDLALVAEAGQQDGITRRFYLWVNDYTKAADPYPPGVRPARLWYWKRKVPDPQKPAGYWKWESTLTQRGECKTPNLEEAATYLREKRAELAKAPTSP